MKVDAHSNNEAEYATLAIALQICLNRGVHHVCINGDALLVVKQVLEVWKSKNTVLREWCSLIKGLLKRFEAWSLQHIERAKNEEAHNAAQDIITEVFVLKACIPMYCGRESLSKEENFLLACMIPGDVEKHKKHGFVRRAKKCMLMDDVLYMKGAVCPRRRSYIKF